MNREERAGKNEPERMSRRRHGKFINGIVLLDKPAGITSNRALQIARRLFCARKAGHTGSLDPFATGMLPICFGEASKTAAFMIDSDKTYRASARLGVATDSGDIDGSIINELQVPALTEQVVKTVFDSFTGEIEQIPPMYSALKHEGQPLYKLAREGKTIERKSRKRVIHYLKLISVDDKFLEFEVKCSKGTYIRTLAEDMAVALGSCAHLFSLRRLSVDPFDPALMVSLDQLEKDAQAGTIDQHLLPLDAGLPDWPLVCLEARQALGFKNGNPQNHTDGKTGWVRVCDQDQRPLGLGECTEEGLLKPKRVYNLEEE